MEATNSPKRTPTLSQTTVAILAGGFGTRLREVLADRPKVLAEVRGKPFLTYLLDQLSNAGMVRVVLCTGYMGGRVKDAFGDTYRNLRLFYSQEGSPVGTAGALRLALPLFGSEFVLVMNGDSLCEMDFEAFYASHCLKRADASLASVWMAEAGRYGRVSTNSERLIIGFEEKNLKASAGWINAGVYLVSRSQIESIPENREVSLEREIFPAMVGRGLYAYQAMGRFIDIGTPESYTAAANLLFS